VIVDSSALIAILRGETECVDFTDLIDSSEHVRISAGTILETSIVIDAFDDAILSRKLNDLIRLGQIEIEPFTAEQASIAREAYADFGKGSGHPAGLNFGDCFAYALAYAMDEPLLFKGGDFSRTDIKAAHEIHHRNRHDESG
jgi:ribonuclease VapC